MNRILVVEDEQHLAHGLQFNLEAEGYQVRTVDTGEGALELLLGTADPFDVVVLDVMLPGKSGFEVMEEVRRAGQLVPTLMLTARNHPEDVLRGFAAGADDYLTKPFDLSILIARVGSLLRRWQWVRARVGAPGGQAAQEAPEADEYAFAGNLVSFPLLELRTGGRTVPLTLMEANLLRYLIRHEGQPVSRKAMLEDVWGLQEDTDTRAIDNFIVRLRRYIEKEPGNPRHLLTVRGVGYRFVGEPGE
ncbi:MAG: response regulator transcription factor [Bryobacteraceae bacterium]|nr:response regulator transcription factor [Bryobacteraceae bacterium]